MHHRYLRGLALLITVSLSLSAIAADKSKNSAATSSAPSYDQPQPQRETLDLNMYQRIREEGVNHSHVMEYASALDDDIPHRELFLSPCHAIYIDGQLIPAGALINGHTIVVPRMLPEVLEYFHIELFEPDVIYAEGVPTETFLPFEGRRTFDNRQEYEDLYVGEQAVTHQPFVPAIPALRAQFQLRSRLRSAVSPWWDVRTPFDTTRDRIEARAERLSAAA